MHAIVMTLLFAILVVEYLVDRRGLLHPYFVLLPELLSGIVMIVVLARLMSGVRAAFDWRYGVFVALLLFTIALGYTVQDVQSGAMVAGIRSYLKFIPFFLLPAVHSFKPREIKQQLMLLLALALLQTPLAIYQRFVEFADAMHSGDPVRGTLTTSSALSLFMITTIAGIVVFYFRGAVRLGVLLVLSAWLFIATTINETKATLVLLPVALIVPALLAPRSTHTLRKLGPLLALGIAAATAFVGAYNYFIQFRQNADSLGELVTSGDLEAYLYSGAAHRDANYIGRFDSIEIALDHTRDDPLTLAFGLGAGNVAESFLPEFSGDYSDYYVRFGVGETQVTTFLWEVGVVGLLAYVYLFWLVARDALVLARSHDSASDLGRIWVVAMIVMTFGLIYKSIFSMNDFGYLFWYFSGLVASRAVLVRQAAHRRAPQPLPEAWRVAARGDTAAQET
jgi:hypothetical protein